MDEKKLPTGEAAGRGRPDLDMAYLGLKEFREMEANLSRETIRELVDKALCRLFDGFFRILEIWIALSIFDFFARG